MASEIIIRFATAMDAVNIARLMRASCENSQAVLVAQVDDLRAIECVTEMLKGSKVLVAELSGRIIGVLACSLMRERWSRTDDWFLCDEFIAIASQWAARGIPEQLLEVMEEIADHEGRKLLLGSSLMSIAWEPILNHRPDYQRLGAFYLRTPKVVDDGNFRFKEDHQEPHTRMA